MLPLARPDGTALNDFGPLLSFALILTSGLVGGEVAARLRMPRVTGWILTGVLLQAFRFEVLSPDRVSTFRPFSDLVLGYIAFTVGSHLHLRSLINAHKRLFLLVLTEALVTPLVVIGFMCFLGGLSLKYGLLFAAIAAAGAPGTTVIVVREARARGVLVKTLIGAVALIDMVAVCLFVLVEEDFHTASVSLGLVVQALPAVLRTLSIAIGVGLGCAGVAIVMTRAIVGPPLLGASLVAAILLGWGVAEWLGVSSILAVTFLGVALANLIADKERAGEAYLNAFASVLFTGFYTLAGMRLEFGHVIPMAGLIALFFLGRFAGKFLSAFTAMSLAGAPRKVRWLLGPALLPHGGVAVGLVIATQSDPHLAKFSDVVLTVSLSALAINQLIGPSATRWALRKAGETGLDRPRLLDFIREQHILVGLPPQAPERVIRTLVDHLFKTHDVQSDKAEFLQALSRRSELDGWYVGEGLLIPHGQVEMGDEMAGVVGLCPEGLEWETPDGRPVHAVVLLATPKSQRDRHLEVLAAFAQLISSERNLRDQLYHADTAAHAYNILHAEENEEFNYFLEDVLEDDSSVVDEETRQQEISSERPVAPLRSSSR